MCGIAGIAVPPGAGVQEPVVRRMTETLRHRGPDAGGVFVHQNVGLGSRRLSVIDTSAAADQPFRNEAGRVAVTFNGEIYNFEELRRRLARRGHRFRTRSDTEVLLRSWEEQGPAMVGELRGMFAFAIFDGRSQELFLARDRFGKKPLYYSLTPERFLFGSEIKALLAAPGVDRGIDEQTVGDYAVYGNSVAERSIFRSIRKLPPAHQLKLDLRAPGFDPRIERYWDWNDLGEPDRAVTRDEWLERLDETLTEAVRLRMISDVPLGAFLSGGIDSSLVVAYMARQAAGRVKTFSIGFEDPAYDESRYARAVAEHLGTEHHSAVVTPDAIAVLPELVAAYDEPFADSSAIPTYYLSQMTREHVTVALSGDGGDELFGGYQRYCQSLRLDPVARALTPAGRALAAGLCRAFPQDTFWRRALGRLSHVGFDLYHDAMGHREEFLALLRRSFRERLPNPAASTAAAAFHRPPGRSLLRRYQAMDLAVYLPEDILVKVDRASMAHSLEVRCPLLDHRVAELAARIPPELHAGPGFQKRLLRELAYRHLPRKLLERPKKGFSVPLTRWFRGELRPVFAEVLADRRSPMWEYFDPAAARRRFDHHVAGRARSGDALWRLLVFHRWCAAHL